MLSQRLTYPTLVQILITFLDLFQQTNPLRYSQSELDETLNVKRNRNQTIIIIGYVAGTEYPPDIEIRNYKRHGRHISGALTYAVNKINTWAQNNSKESLLPSTYQISVHFVETYGEMNNSIQAVAKMSVEKKVWAIIGPEETCRTEADIAMAFNILMISHFCTDNILTEDSQRYSTFVRTRPQVSGLANYLVSFLKRFKWNAVSIISSNDKENEFILQNCLSVLKVHNITILHNKLVMSPAIYGSANNKFNKIVENTFRSTRIYVFIGSDFEIFGLLMALYEKGLTDTGNYFVVSLVLRLEAISDSAFGNIQVDSRSLRNFVIISHIEPEGQLIKTESSKFKYFMSRPPFNVESQDKSNTSYAPMESSYLYDAVLLYATVVGIVLKNQSLGSPKDGMLLKKLLLNRYYKSVFGYMNHIDNKGEAYGNYTVNQLIINANGEMKIDPIGLFKLDDGSLLEFEFMNNKNINWVHDIPRDIPECGFNGEICRTNEKLISIPVSLFILLILVIFVSAFIIKSKRYEKELERLLWKIDRLKELDFSNPELLEKFSFITRPPIKEIENGNVCLPFEEDSQFILAKSCCNIGHILQPDWGTSNLILCMYRNQEVVVKRVFFSSAISITRKVKKELKTLREISYINLNKFMGAIIEHQDTWVVWEFCDRGSLQDVLYSTKLTKEYPVFLSSFAFDVIRGLNFLHENPDICFHGHLKSSNCLVDSRWTVKLTDFGMREFLTNVSPLPDTPEYIYFLSMFWTAPEILRDMIQHKSHNNQFLQNLKLGLMSERKRSHENKTDVNPFNLSNDESCLEAFIKIKFPANPNNLDSISFQKSDIYSFGMIFYELHSCQIPFLSNYSSQNSPKEIIRRLIVLNDQFKVPYRPKLSLLSRTDKKQIDLIKLCWQENAAQRPTAKVIYNRFKVLFGEKKNLVECMKEKMILYTKNLEKEVMKRTEELREEKKQNEELLYQMLPIPVAEQLRQHKQVEAEAFDSVSIYFSDIVGFTELAGFCSPFEVINLLNQLYTSFDKIIDNFNVYKVETIGDSYMVVSGLPTQFDEHAREMANMSLRLLEEITKGFVIPSEKYKNERLKLRIGLHSGPCCAGVVGTRNPRYCLFGDTVNMASRMESNGEALKIHCSEAFVLQILYLNEFHIVERGVIEVKGKGSVNTFWLIGKLEQNISNNDTLKFIHSPSHKSNSEISPDVLMLEKSFKGKSKNNFFEKRKENTYKTKFQKRDLIK